MSNQRSDNLAAQTEPVQGRVAYTHSSDTSQPTQATGFPAATGATYPTLAGGAANQQPILALTDSNASAARPSQYYVNKGKGKAYL